MSLIARERAALTDCADHPALAEAIALNRSRVDWTESSQVHPPAFRHDRYRSPVVGSVALIFAVRHGGYKGAYN